MSNNVTSFEGRKPLEQRVRDGRKARVEAMATGVVAHLRRTDELFRVRSEAAERKANIKRMIGHEILKIYSVCSPDEAARIVAEAHEEVRRSKGVKS